MSEKIKSENVLPAGPAEKAGNLQVSGDVQPGSSGSRTVSSERNDVSGSPKWYVAVVKNRSERKAAQQLDSIGVENYVPVQPSVTIRKSGKEVRNERVVIPAKVFVKCHEAQRRKEVARLPYILRFMTNRAGSSASVGHPVATVTDAEIQTLKFMLGQSDVPVSITEPTYEKGNLVVVTRGSLIGLKGEVIDMSADKSELIVRLDTLGCARLTIDTASLALQKDDMGK